MTATNASNTLGSSHLPLREVVAAEMRRMILGGELLPGERLIEDRLAERLDVSRNPIREAMRVLSTEGFLEVTARRGAFVASMSAQEAENLFDVRLALEPLSARLASVQITKVGIKRLEEIQSRAKKAYAKTDLDALADLNTEFHTCVFELSENTYLAGIGAPMVKRSQWLFRHSASDRAPQSWAEHQGLIHAIASGDGDLSETEARRHVLAARASYRQRA
ncbi:DNA-binding GntR family transcriptional regulator [Nakamurella sp. UYEF19]|uniref:GntR family transcriptional regulator n=1 Tax=Nakamurella sp. UYEF19 TaxID=1756392 RepID=UPI00339A35D9